MRTPNPIDIAWFAGILDGEGTIIIVKRKKVKGGFQLCVKIVMTHLPTIERIMEIWEVGRTYLVPRKDGRYPQGLWSCHANQALSVLEAALPYLFTKKEQAQIGIAFQTRLKNQHSLRRGKFPQYLENQDAKFKDVLSIAKNPSFHLQNEINDILKEQRGLPP